MARRQNDGNRILLMLLLLIISMSLSACTVGNDSEKPSSASGITDEHSESDPAVTQTVTDLTVEDVPTLVPDVLNLQEQDTIFSRKHTMCLVRIRIPLSVPGMPGRLR